MKSVPASAEEPGAAAAGPSEPEGERAFGAGRDSTSEGAPGRSIRSSAPLHDGAGVLAALRHVQRMAETPAPTPSGPMPLPEPLRLETMARAILARAAEIKPDGTAELRFALQPADLGEVRVSIESRGERVKIVLEAASLAAVETLAPGLARLTSELESAGYRHPEVQLQLGSFAEPGRHAREGHHPARERRRAASAVGFPEHGAPSSLGSPRRQREGLLDRIA